ncbi:uncharacterized protein LOC116779250 [Danaus plexippus]|uniref:Uncharacterized protein n=1 Tax=Danaus plexippus plexippus TaxID=278856 RepID=A0A212FB45_DANPL|nr:uncharacterized protein LOC116779250 [Danaus plexippus]OWR50964.1 hypothetical protein KGM_208796 [Danaus plexippus plexippus]
MLTGFLVFSLISLQTFQFGYASSLLCGRTKEVEVGSNVGAGAALALTLLRPQAATTSGPCQLKLNAPDAAAFTVRLIDVKESLSDWEWSQYEGPGARKWSGRSAPAQDAVDDNTRISVANNTDSCKLLVYISDTKTPIWRLSLCGGNAAAVAAKAGTKLLPPKIKLVWTPPTTTNHHTEKLRLVVTAVNSGSVCNNESQFVCGVTSLCISSSLVCDGVKHCPGGEDEDGSACSHRRDSPLLEMLRRFAARNQEFLGLDQPDGVTKPSVIMKITEGEQKQNAFMEFAAALKPYGPWSYLVVGMLVCATILMFCLAWECCCKRSKPSDTPINIPASCIDLSPTVTVTASSQQLFEPAPSPPEYEPPPSYSSLFPRAYKSSPSPVPHCSHQEPD